LVQVSLEYLEDLLRLLHLEDLESLVFLVVLWLLLHLEDLEILAFLEDQ
jgi:hypothetical protein